MSHDIRRQAACALRNGISFFEFVGCLAALSGGVAIGAMYLGVDVKRAAVTGLRQMGLVETTTKPAAESAEPATLAPAPSAQAAAPIAAPTASPQPAPAPEAIIAAKASADASSKAETPGTPAKEFTGPAAAIANNIMSPEELLTLTPQQQQVLTKAYWDALQTIMDQEVAYRVSSIRDDGNWQLFDFLTGRKEGHEAASAAIAKLSRRGVDGHVLAYADKAKAWHDSGVSLFSRAVDLLTDAPSAQLSGPFAQSWQSAATQHRMEEKLLRQKSAAVKTYLEHAGDEQTAGEMAVQ
jgi:hypothetical protein